MEQEKWENKFNTLLTTYLGKYTEAILNGRFSKFVNDQQDKLLLDFIRSQREQAYKSGYEATTKDLEQPFELIYQSDAVRG